MIAPVNHEHPNEAPTEPFMQPSERLPCDEEGTTQQRIDKLRRLIGEHPVASVVAGVAVGVVAGWIVKRGRW